jgi:hypothetical protein
MCDVLLKELGEIDTTQVSLRRVSTHTSIIIEHAKLLPHVRIRISYHQLLLYTGEAVTFRAVYF